MSADHLRRTGPVRRRTLVPTVTLGLIAAVPLAPAAEQEPADTPHADHDHDHHHDHGSHTEHEKPALWRRDLGDEAQLRLIDLSAVLNVAAGVTTGDTEELEAFVTGAHDPDRDGFTFRELELGLSGAVDPYFRADAILVVTEDGLELEEASATTTGLPAGLVAEGGYFLTEFGHFNPTHPHSWAAINQPLVIGAMLGSEGTRGVGARVAYRIPAPWTARLHLGAQNADDESMISFLGDGHAHGEEEGEEDAEHAAAELDGLDDLLWLLRLEQSWEMGGDGTAALGLSLLAGPNQAHEHTYLWGIDLGGNWSVPGLGADGGRLDLVLEFIGREAGLDDGADRSSWGVVGQAVYAFHSEWSAGLRVDYVDLEHLEEEEEEGHVELEEALRLSPLVRYQPSAYTGFRLQYDYTEPADGDAFHGIWLGLEVMLGGHAGHAH